MSGMAQSGLTSEGVLRDPGGRVRIRTLAAIRWVAIIGQAAAILIVHFGLGFSLPVVSTSIVVAASALLNVAATLLRPASARLRDNEAALFLAYDILQLAVLLYLTGGLQNPFALLFLAPATISATILSLRSTVILSLLALSSISVLAVFHRPLPWSGDGIELPDLYVAGVWAALALGTLFIVAYAWRVAAEARRMSDALAATQMALAREQQMSALGALAAAAAHELGTPLATIALVSRELEKELSPDDPMAEDVTLLNSEAARCRDILARLARTPGEAGEHPYRRMPLPQLVEYAAEPYEKNAEVEVSVEIAAGTDRSTAPSVAFRPEILQGLGNFIENAIQFAQNRVTLGLAWDERYISIEIGDDGPGFSPDMLHRLGEPYVSTRRQSGRMGLGVFIAKTLLERTGARVRFDNQPEGGASVKVRWRRSDLIALEMG